MQHYECELICHYVDELESIEKDFQNATYHYHYDAAQYEQIFKQYDCIISPRIHGCGIASSLGIPSIHIAHSDRSETTKEFKSFTWCRYRFQFNSATNRRNQTKYA